MSIKISELPSASVVNNGDYVAIVQDGTTKKATASMLSADIATTINSSSTNNTAAGAKAVYDYAAPKKHDSEQQTYGAGTDTKYGHVMIVDNLNESSYQAGKALSSHQGYVIKGLLDDKQDIINGYNKIDADYVDDTTSENKFITEEQIQEIEELKAENEALLDQIPTATATGDNINVQDSSNLPLKDFAMLGNATQADTPTPDTPQDIHVVTGDNTLEVVGKNLIDKTQFAAISNCTITDNIITTSALNIGNRNVTFYFTNTENSLFKLIEGRTYYVSADIRLKSGTTSSSLLHMKSDVGTNATDTEISSPTITSTFQRYQFSFVPVTTIQSFQSSRFLFQFGTTGLSDGVFEIKNVMLSYSSDIAYEEYTTPQTQLLSNLPELAKIGNYTDRIYKDNGKWYKYAMLKKVVLDGTNIAFSGKSSSTVNTIWMTPTDNELKNYNSTQPYTLPISNYFIGNNTLFTTNIEGIFVENKRVKCGFTNETDLTTLELANEWLKTHNVIAYCQLDTPTTTEITDTTLIGQLENILKMRTIRNTTNGWIEPSGTNAQAGLTLTYYRDLQTITDKIDSLEARVSLLE